jgi:hypothetical protein
VEAEQTIHDLTERGLSTDYEDTFDAVEDLLAMRDAFPGNPTFGSGRHSRGGLWGQANDYFGEDHELDR